MEEKVEVYAPEIMKKALELVFDSTGLNVKNAIYIDMNNPKGEFGLGKGLELADELAKSYQNKKIVVFGFDSIQRLWLEPKFKKAMANSNVQYLYGICELKDYYNILQNEKLENPALRAVANVDIKNNLVSKLKHDYHYNPEDILKQTRTEFGFEGTDEEVKEKLFSYQSKSVIEPQFFPGVFCDIEGTILSTFEDQINYGLLEELVQYSKTKPVNIWTGGNLREIIPKLYEANIEYPIFSKSWFKGCEVEIVIDDLSQEKFVDDYDIKSRKYQKVNLEDWLK